MPAALPSRRSLRARGVRRKRVVLWVLVGIALLLIASVAWVGIRGWMAKGELEAAQALVSEMKTQALSFDVDGASETFERITEHTAAAAELTGDPVWRAAEVVPVLGKNLTVVRELASAVQGVITDVAAPLLEVASSLDPAAITPKDGAIDLEPIIAAIPALEQAEAGLNQATASVTAIDADGTIEQVRAARDKVTALLGSVAPIVQSLNDVLPMLPPALGSEGKRTYAVMFQNNAEARPLGGTALSFAVVTVDAGRVSLVGTVPSGFENFPLVEQSVIPVPDGVEELYNPGAFGTFIANATLRPKFASAAEITQAMWLLSFGSTVDAIISVDPVALSYLLRATGPITMSSGEVLTNETLVPVLLNEVYQRFNTGDDLEDNRLQDMVYADAVGSTFSRLTNGPFDFDQLLPAVVQSLTERRIMFWSARPEEQAMLSAHRLDGELPVSDETTDRVGLYFQDNVGSKLNYYLRQSVLVEHGVCRADGLQSIRVTTTMASVLDPAAVGTLSNSIIGQWRREGVLPGVQRMLLYLYAPPGAQIVGATVDGVPVALAPLHDEVYPVGKIQIALNPGAGGVVSFELVSATPGQRVVETLLTPLVTPTVVTTQPIDCGTVSAG